jgi:hypothetical protein
LAQRLLYRFENKDKSTLKTHPNSSKSRLNPALRDNRRPVKSAAMLM